MSIIDKSFDFWQTIVCPKSIFCPKRNLVSKMFLISWKSSKCRRSHPNKERKRLEHLKALLMVQIDPHMEFHFRPFSLRIYLRNKIEELEETRLWSHFLRYPAMKSNEKVPNSGLVHQPLHTSILYSFGVEFFSLTPVFNRVFCAKCDALNDFFRTASFISF